MLKVRSLDQLGLEHLKKYLKLRYKIRGFKFITDMYIFCEVDKARDIIKDFQENEDKYIEEYNLRW